MKFFDDGKGGFTQGFGMGGTRSFHLMTIFTILSGTHTSCDSYIALSLCFMWFVSEDFDIRGQRLRFQQLVGFVTTDLRGSQMHSKCERRDEGVKKVT